MDILKGYRTMIVMGASLLAYLLAWPELTQYVSPKVLASATAVVGIVLRIVTTTPLGGGPAQPPSVTPKALAWLVLAPLLAWSGVAQAADFRAPEQYSWSDSQMYFQSFKGSSQSYAASGACFGPVRQLSHNGQWIADFLSLCTHGNVQLKADGEQNSEVSLSFGPQLFNWWGLQVGVEYNPLVKVDNLKDRFVWGVGFSITGAIKQLMKSTTPPPVTPPVGTTLLQ